MLQSKESAIPATEHEAMQLGQPFKTGNCVQILYNIEHRKEYIQYLMQILQIKRGILHS